MHVCIDDQITCQSLRPGYPAGQPISRLAAVATGHTSHDPLVPAVERRGLITRYMHGMAYLDMPILMHGVWNRIRILWLIRTSSTRALVAEGDTGVYRRIV